MPILVNIKQIIDRRYHSLETTGHNGMFHHRMEYY
jgi:hypothetical protein